MRGHRILSAAGIALTMGLATLGIDGQALAADILRGPYGGEVQPRAVAGPDWAGVYVGAYVGASSGNVDPRSMAGPLTNQTGVPAAIASTVQSMLGFKETNKTGTSYGAFVGANWLWDDVVLGIEADYTRSSLKVNSSNTQTRTVQPTGTTDQYVINSTSASRARISDWTTIRGRVGYAMGNFLPYLTAGLAIGNINANASVNGNWTLYDVSGGAPVIYPPATCCGTFSGAIGRRGISYGTAVGAGVDMQLLPNTFLRAEWQYVRFASDSQRPDVYINTARVGGGVKF